MIFFIASVKTSVGQTIPKEPIDSDSELRNQITKGMEEALQKIRANFNTLDSTLTFNNVILGSDFAIANKILQIKQLGDDSKILEYGLVRNDKFCKIDKYLFIGFAFFTRNRLTQIILESMSEYRHVASYLIKYYGLPDEYSNSSQIWLGKNIKMTITDNTKNKKNNSIGKSTITITKLRI